MPRPGPLERWSREARVHAQALRWPLHRLPAVVRTLEETFGREWLLEKIAVPSRFPLTGNPTKHPIGTLLAVAHRTAMMQTIELAVYLRSCRELPRFAEVVAHLRAAPQFSTGRMQLALAHRFALAGATEIELEPHARHRRADLYFRVGGRSHLVECYEPVSKRAANRDDLLHGSVERIFATASELRTRPIVRVDLRCSYSEMTQQMRKRIEQEAQYLLRSLRSPALCERKRLSDFDIEVSDTPGLSENDAHALAMSFEKGDCWVVAPTMVRVADRPEERIPRGESLPRRRCGWFVVNAKPTDASAEMREIADAIEGKLGQVRSDDPEVLGLMVAITNFAQSASSFDARPLIESLRAKVLAVHDGLAGVLIVDRADRKEDGPFVGGLLMMGREGGHLDAFHAALATREREHRVIDDWID